MGEFDEKTKTRKGTLFTAEGQKKRQGTWKNDEWVEGWELVTDPETQSWCKVCPEGSMLEAHHPRIVRLLDLVEALPLSKNKV